MRNAPAEAPPPPVFPALAADVVLHAPKEEDAGWFVQRGSAQYFAVQPDLARLLGALDGHRDAGALAGELGAPWTEDVVRTTLTQVAAAGLLEQERPGAKGGRGRRRPSRFRFVPPFTVQLTLFRPGPRFTAAARRLGRIPGRAAAVVCGTLGVAGLVALALQWGDLLAALGRPQPYVAILFVFLAVLATTAVHELAHGVLLAARGGRPSRMGVMLFYLMPAFFCDVSDGWRLRSGRARVEVALAGIAVQVAIAGTAAVVALLVPPGPSAALLLFAVSSFMAAAANAVPFVKLDGYIALMNHVGVNYLRDKAIEDARAASAHRLLGAPAVPRQVDRSWSVPFGVACVVFPIVITVQAIVIWADLFDRAGLVGAALLTLLLGTVAWRAWRTVQDFFTNAWRSGAPRLRVVALAAVVLAGVGGLAWWPVADRVVGGYELSADGQARLVFPQGGDAVDVAPGTPVGLLRTGILLRLPTGTAVVGDGPVVDEWVPAAALLPVTDEFPTVPATVTSLDDVVGEPDERGMAVVELGTVPLAEWVYGRTVGGLLGGLGG